jgi:hypothetical protein
MVAYDIGGGSGSTVIEHMDINLLLLLLLL